MACKVYSKHYDNKEITALRKSAKREIFRIVSVLGLAVVCAALLAAYMIFHYGPSGRYAAGNTVLAPSVMEKINYKDKSIKGNNQVRFIFNRIEFAYFDKIKGQLLQFPVDQAVYEKFYQLVQSDQSLDPVPTDVQNEFVQGMPATLSIIVQADINTAPKMTQVLQVIQLTENDHYRVRLSTTTTNGAQEWAYFYHPHLYEEIMRLFTKA